MSGYINDQKDTNEEEIEKKRVFFPYFGHLFEKDLGAHLEKNKYNLRRNMSKNYWIYYKTFIFAMKWQL